MFGSKRKSSRAAGQWGDLSWAGKLGLFFLLILGLISVPFILLAGIVGVRLILEYHVYIIAGILLLLGAVGYLLVRKGPSALARFDREEGQVMEIIRVAAEKGHGVDISLLYGLVKIGYRGNEGEKRLLPHETQRLTALPPGQIEAHGTGYNEDAGQDPDTATGLDHLLLLLQQGRLTEVEYRRIRQRSELKPENPGKPSEPVIPSHYWSSVGPAHNKRKQ
jgi:hypothetical protein